MELSLTQGKTALIDEEDAPRVLRHSWSFGHGYAEARIDSQYVYLHRFIMGVPGDSQVDHKNLNKLDCRKTNLRLATSGQNAANRPLQANNTTGFKGVGYEYSRQQYRVDICLNRKRLFVGRFKTAEEAARAYDKKAKELFGEFAWLNFPEETSGSEVGSDQGVPRCEDPSRVIETLSQRNGMPD